MTGQSHHRTDSMNDHIIQTSFDEDMDISGESEHRENAESFKLSPDSIDAEFETVKPKQNKRKIIAMSIVAGLAIGAVVMLAQLFLGARPDKPTIPLADSGVQLPDAGAQSTAVAPTGLAADAKPVATGETAKVGGGAVVPPQASAVMNGSPAVAAAAPATPPSQGVPAASTAAVLASVAPTAVSTNQAAPQPTVTTKPAAPASLAAPAEVVPQQKAAEVEKAVMPEKSPKAVEAKKPDQKPAQAATAPQKPSQPAKQASPTTNKSANAEVAAPHEAAQEAVKPLVTFSAGQLGLRSFSPDTLILVANKTSQPVRYRVGDALPSGDVIEKLDSASMTVVTNRKVIRILN